MSRRKLLVVSVATAIAFGWVAAGCFAPRLSATPDERAAVSGDLVVLLHGMGRSPLAMRAMERSLERAGFRVLNVGYDSYTQNTAQIEAQVLRQIERARAARPAARVHLVGHSLGAVLARDLGASGRIPGTTRIVQLAPPNQGAAAAVRMTPWMGWLQRPMRELRPGSAFVSGLPARVPDTMQAVVVVATRDGKVRMDETVWDGAERVVTPGVHTFLMQRPDVIRATARFLRTGEMIGVKE